MKKARIWIYLCIIEGERRNRIQSLVLLVVRKEERENAMIYQKRPIDDNTNNMMLLEQIWGVSGQGKTDVITHLLLSSQQCVPIFLPETVLKHSHFLLLFDWVLTESLR